MTEIMRRRRGLIGYNKPVYSLYNKSISTGDEIDTGMHPWSDGGELYILLDYTTDVAPTSGTASTRKLLLSYNSTNSNWGLIIGKKSSSDTTLSCWWNCAWNSQTAMGNSSVAAGRHRIVVKHQKNSNDLTVYYKYNNGTMRTYQYTSAYADSPINTLHIGGNDDFMHLPAGTITKMEIYNKAITDGYITKFME